MWLEQWPDSLPLVFWQVRAAIGNVVAGSLFAGLRSFGAVGGFIGMAIAGVGGLVSSFFFDCCSK